MSIEEEFEKWWDSLEMQYGEPSKEDIWNACAELMQAEIDRRDAIIKRLIADYVVDDDDDCDQEAWTNKVFERLLKKGL